MDLLIFAVFLASNNSPPIKASPRSRKPSPMPNFSSCGPQWLEEIATQGSEPPAEPWPSRNSRSPWRPRHWKRQNPAGAPWLGNDPVTNFLSVSPHPKCHHWMSHFSLATWGSFLLFLSLPWLLRSAPVWCWVRHTLLRQNQCIIHQVLRRHGAEHEIFHAGTQVGPRFSVSTSKNLPIRRPVRAQCLPRSNRSTLPEAGCASRDLQNAGRWPS